MNRITARVGSWRQHGSALRFYTAHRAPRRNKQMSLPSTPTLSVRSQQRLLAAAQQRVTALLSTSASSSSLVSVETELKDAMDALMTYREQQQPQQAHRSAAPVAHSAQHGEPTLRRTGSSVCWVASASAGPSRTLADVQSDEICDQQARGASASWHGSLGSEPQHSDTPPPITAERRAALFYATLLHWVYVAATRLPAYRFAQHQEELFALLVPPAPPPVVESVAKASSRVCGKTSLPRSQQPLTAAEALARSLWRRGAQAYVELLVQHTSTPASADAWCHIRSVLAIGESVINTSATEHDEASALRRVTATRRSSTSTTTTTTTTRGHAQDDAVCSFCVAALPLLPSGELWCLRVHHCLPFASTQSCTTWEVLVALLTWSKRWDGAAARASAKSKGDVLHIESRDILAAMGACLQQGRTGDDPCSDPVLAAVLRRLTSLWETARAAEQAFPALAAACGVDKTAHQRLLLQGHKLILTGGEASDSGESVAGTSRTDTQMTSLSSSATSAGLVSFASTTSRYNGWAVRGRWTDIQDDLAAQSARLIATNASVLRAETRSAADPVLGLFAQWPPLRIPTFLRAHASPRLPDSLATSPVTSAEHALLLEPPTAGLDVLLSSVSASASAVPAQARRDRASQLAVVADASVASGRDARAPTLLAVELRRRLWCLATSPLPPQIAKAVVCFSRSPSLAGVAHVVAACPHDLARGGQARHRGQRAAPARLFPFVWRVPAKEWLPWYVVACIGSAIANVPSEGDAAMAVNTLRAAVEALQQSVWPALFRPLVDYAASHEHCIAIYVQIAHLQQGDHRQIRASVCDARGRVLRGDLWAQAAWWLFCPPLERCCLEEEAESTKTHQAHDVQVQQQSAYSLSALTSRWRALRRATTPAEVPILFPTAAASSSASSPMYAHTVLHDDWFALLADKVSNLRNYHVSLALETLSRVDGAALGQLMTALHDEFEAAGPVVLAPESVVAITTALVLLLLPAMTATTTDVVEAGDSGVLAEVGQLLATYHSQYLYFAVPAEKTYNVSSYFKALHDPCFLTRCVSHAAPSSSSFVPLPSRHGWTGAEALLLGRSLRLVDRFPTTATAPFFHLRDAERDGQGTFRQLPRCECIAPDLTYELYRVDVVKAFCHFWRSSQGETHAEARTTRTPAVVAAGLPYGMTAVYKPAGTNCTLHAAYPSLIPFLATHVPWRTSLPMPTDIATRADHLMPSTVPMLHQHGLVNRVDVGTSGLVLVVDTHVSLRAAVEATLTRHDVRKYYRALVQFTPPPAAYWGALTSWFLPTRGVITSPVYADGVTDPGAFLALQLQQLQPATSRKRLSTALLDRRPACTYFRVLEYFPRHGVYYIEVELESGRRHQIRQHFASIGHPLVGDVRYHHNAARGGARASWGLDRPALHAAALRIAGPSASTLGEGGANVDEPAVAFVQCELPSDMARVLSQLRGE